jgi:ABC-2 type transport system permease protein
MLGRLQAVNHVNHVNPQSYEVEALRGLLIGTPAPLWLDLGVLPVATALGVAAACRLLGRLAR